MTIRDLIELLEKLPKDYPIVGINPDSSDEGLGHWFEPRYLHLNGYEILELKDCKCIKFKFGEKDEGWTDDCWEAIYDGRFFKVNGLDKNDFAFTSIEKPTKDGNYLCICQHGKRYTIENNSFFAKVMDDGKERADNQWGFSCEHIPMVYGNSYPVIAWSRKSYKSFREADK